ncbi:MAG: amidoligase family protein [Hyphomicrobiaceae bacterium]
MFYPTRNVILPPRLTGVDGAARRVGVEIEFAGLSARDTAHLIAQHLGGEMQMVDEHRYDVVGGKLGPFRAELDSRYVHPEGILGTLQDAPPDWLVQLSELVSGTLGHAGAIVIPCEVVGPPVTVDQLPQIDDLIAHLRKAGAQGTDRSVFYAFGVHLNPEIATRDPAWLLSVLRAQCLMSPWLRTVMEIDTSRYLTGFAAPFPQRYIDLILQPGYAPDLDVLIADYVAHNPRRDRELDMLPLFAWLDRDRIGKALPTEKIGARPTFHYRLPNAALERAAWSVVLEWNRWCLLERIAESPDLIRSLSEAYRHLPSPFDQARWTRQSSEWLAHNFHLLAAHPNDGP